MQFDCRFDDIWIHRSVQVHGVVVTPTSPGPEHYNSADWLLVMAGARVQLALWSSNRSFSLRGLPSLTKTDCASAVVCIQFKSCQNLNINFVVGLLIGTISSPLFVFPGAIEPTSGIFRKLCERPLQTVIRHADPDY